MLDFPKSERALTQVRNRLVVRLLAHRTFVITLILAVFYCVLLLAGRLTGLFPFWFQPWSVAVVPALGFLIAVLIPMRPGKLAAAHAVDRFHDTKDLFLTLNSLGSSSCEYSPLVGRDAEKVADKIDAEKIVPYQWEHPSLVTACTLGILLLGAYFVPTLDPFGNVAVAKQGEQQRKLLEETERVTKARKAVLESKEVDEENSEGVEKALDKLTKIGFEQAKKGEKRENQLKLNQHQKEIGEMYRKLNSGELRSLFDKAKTDQQLGALNDEEKFRKWQKELQQGSSESMQNEVEKMAEKIEELAKEKDPVKKTEIERQLKKQIKEMSDFSENKAGSKDLKAALQRAMEQLDAAKNEELSKEAMQALKESLDVAKEEMKALSQSARDLKKLEDALELISQAKQLNSEDKLDGEMFDGEMSLEDYAEMYAELMGQQGEGTGGEGMGDSESVEEDDAIKTDFIDEKSKSAIQKGKILMSMKTKGLSEAGEIKEEDYKRVVGEINQSLDAVIDQEQIPPGYVDGIKKYFDSLEKTPQ